MGELSPKHLEMLRDGSGISDAVIEARGYQTITDPGELTNLGFAPAQRRVPGLLLPLWTTDGGNSLAIYRPDNPRVLEDRRRGKLPGGTYPNKVIKYEVPKGDGVRVDCPPACQPMLANPSIPLWITEGQKKADCLASRGLCAIALLGVWNFKGRNEFGGVTVLADLDYVAWDGRDVRLVFDSDVMTKREVRQALDRLTEHLQRKGAHVAAVYLPGGPNGKVGVDDWLVAGHSIQELETLAEVPRPEPKAAAPVVELLDEVPATISRPLALIDGCAYAATWLPVRVTTSESVNSKGEIVRHDPPLVETRQFLLIVRDDGVLFGDIQDPGVKPLADLGLGVHLPELPPPGRLWSTQGVKRFKAGQRPDPADVFSRMVDTISRFIDFDRSLADQRTMSEMIGCYILATWFLDAFNVVGFLWPNGDRGTGKTQLLTIICELAYLGQVILAGGSYACLRDLADYGATLAFDDAENLSDQRRSDPDKRALLLAGNRRGNVVPVKELTSDKTWRTRYVNTFCPRLFSAIKLPDDVLASRTIVIPLIRTPDRYRANADPLDFALWPHDRRQLLDDLWSLGLAHLAELTSYEVEVNQQAQLTGRNLEPWRAILAVAAWLDDRDVDGLRGRIGTLSVAYQSERPDLEYGDLTALVIQALYRCCDISDVVTLGDIKKETPWILKTSQITDMVVTVAKELEADVDTERITSRRVGRILGKMRLKKVRESGTGQRQWQVTPDDLRHWTRSYGPISVDTHCADVTDVIDVTDVTDE